jgi:hypothetical protein
MSSSDFSTTNFDHFYLDQIKIKTPLKAYAGRYNTKEAGYGRTAPTTGTRRAAFLFLHKQ